MTTNQELCAVCDNPFEGTVLEKVYYRRPYYATEHAIHSTCVGAAFEKFAAIDAQVQQQGPFCRLCMKPLTNGAGSELDMKPKYGSFHEDCAEDFSRSWIGTA